MLFWWEGMTNCTQGNRLTMSTCTYIYWTQLLVVVEGRISWSISNLLECHDSLSIGLSLEYVACAETYTVIVKFHNISLENSKNLHCFGCGFKLEIANITSSTVHSGTRMHRTRNLLLQQLRKYIVLLQLLPNYMYTVAAAAAVHVHCTVTVHVTSTVAAADAVHVHEYKQCATVRVHIARAPHVSRVRVSCTLYRVGQINGTSLTACKFESCCRKWMQNIPNQR